VPKIHNKPYNEQAKLITAQQQELTIEKIKSKLWKIK